MRRSCEATGPRAIVCVAASSLVTLSYGSIGLLTRPLGRYLARVYGGQYAGETTMSNLSQMAGITVHSFLSTASG